MTRPPFPRRWCGGDGRALRRRLALAWEIGRELLECWRKDQGPFLSAAMAYYAVFSLVPLLVIIVTGAQIVFGPEAARSTLASQLESLLGENTTAAVISLIDRTAADRARLLATSLGVVALVFGASGVFGRLRAALNVIWEVEPPNRHPVIGFLRDRLIPFVMVVIFAALVVASFIAGAALSVLRRDLDAALRVELERVRFDMPGVDIGVSDLVAHSPMVAKTVQPVLSAARSLQMVDLVLSVAFASLLFAFIFKLVPDAPIQWGDVWLGALLAGVFFTIGKLGLQIYLYNASIVNAYGAAGSLVVIMLWVNYSAQILFLGAEFTKVYARRYGSRSVSATTATA